MTIQDLEHFRDVLRERERHLSEWLESHSPDRPGDTRHAQGLLSDLRLALARVDNGTYGGCTACDGTMELHRLEVQPTREICLTCFSEDEKRALEDELFLASKIHRALLPQTVEPIDGFDLSVQSLAAGTVGGDFFNFFPPRSGGGTRVVVADTMGKGVPAALIMSHVQGALRILSEEIDSPARLLSRLNSWLCRNVPVTKFVTLTCVSVDVTSSPRAHLTYANAGHCPPILVRTGGAVERLDPTGGVLGVHEQFEYTERKLQMHPGDLLLIYTDGVTEAASPSGELYDEARLIERVSPWRSMPSEEILSRLLNDVREFTGSDTFQDDMTVVALKRHG